MRLFFCAAAAVSLGGCGYSVGGLIEHEAVSVPMFDSLSERRTHEFDLHRAVTDEAKKRGVRVDPAAPVELKGRILDITEPTLVENPGDVPIVGAVSFRFEAALVDRATKRELWKRVLEESASFSTGRSESRETARQEVMDRLARRVINLLEKDW